MRWRWLGFLLFAGAVTSRAAVGDAMIAHRLLADIAEVRVVRVDRSASAAEERAPIYGVAFAFENLVWFYAPESGTRVLGAVTSDWADADTLKRRLRQTDPTVSAVRLYPQPTSIDMDSEFNLRNACVIASIAALTDLLGQTSTVREAGLVLLSYRGDEAKREASVLVDHCLLVYRESGAWRCVDPQAPGKPFALAGVAIGAPLDPALVALALRERYPVKSARLLTIGGSTLHRLSESALWRKFSAARDPLY